MPIHYAEDVNVISGRVHFEHQKIAFVYFKNSQGEQVSFSKRPFVSLTITDMTTQPASRLGWIRSGGLFVGCKIRFVSKQTLDVDWEVKS